MRFRTPVVLVLVCSLPETSHSQRETLRLAELLFQPQSHELPDEILVTVGGKCLRCTEVFFMPGFTGTTDCV